MQEWRTSMNGKSISENYFSPPNNRKRVRKAKRSTSTSRLQEDEDEYEEITDLNYILTEAEWREFLNDSPKKASEVMQQRIICSIKVGLPERQRGNIWEYLVNVKKYKSKEEHNYQYFLEADCVDNSDYTISKDIMRTFPE